MPIYEYTCTECQHEIEALQKLSDAPLVECPQCGELALKKKISAAGFRLSGKGWYETDFKTGGKQKNLVRDSAPETSKGTSNTSDKPSKGSEPAKSSS